MAVRKLYSGFTMIEMMVTLAVAVVFLVMAVPGYYSVIQNNKVVTIANNFSASLSYARSEAIKRGTDISICPSANTAFTACAVTNNWANGWIVFVDSDGNGVLASNADRLKIQQALPLGTTLTASGNYITYASSGFVRQGSGINAIAAAGCSGNNGRQISLSKNQIFFTMLVKKYFKLLG